MCQVGDIIVINDYIGEDGVELTQHSFVIISEESGIVRGCSYDFVANVMSSFKDKKHKEKKLSFEENFELSSSDVNIENSNGLDGFIKADKLYFFAKENLDYYVIRSINHDILKKLIKLIFDLDKKDKLVTIVENLE
jgi:hypothetical protein